MYLVSRILHHVHLSVLGDMMHDTRYMMYMIVIMSSMLPDHVEFVTDIM